MLSGGTVSGVTNSGGFQEIFSGAVVIGVKVEGGGIETLESAAVVSGTLVDGGVQFVESGSTAIATKVISGSQIVLLSGGGRGALAVGFAADGTRHGGTLPITPGTAATAALFGHYIAGSLLAGTRAYGDGLTVEASAGQHPHLTPPHG